MVNNYKIGEYGKRPWGHWRVDEIGQGFVKKTITVNIGGCLSLQSHKHREEFWEIISGTAEVTINREVFIFTVGETIKIPLQAKHRLKNIGNEVLIVKEIQLGEILDESDIIRYEDAYGRIENSIFVADMDGTLTPARLPMTSEFEVFFLKFITKHEFYIVTGSDLKKLKEQVSEKVQENVAGMYCSMGNEFYIKNKLIYEHDFIPEQNLIEKLENYRKNTLYPGKLFENYIEKRKGMINFSVLGRDCSMFERKEYKKWDDVHKERKQIANELSESYPQYDISIGGNISIDIVPHGFGKEQIAKELRDKYPDKKIYFIGDRTEKGGNDYLLAQAVLKLGNSEIIAVSGPDDTLKFLKEKL